jgi:hypothetical protein
MNNKPDIDLVLTEALSDGTYDTVPSAVLCVKAFKLLESAI